MLLGKGTFTAHRKKCMTKVETKPPGVATNEAGAFSFFLSDIFIASLRYSFNTFCKANDEAVHPTNVLNCAGFTFSYTYHPAYR